MRILLRHRHSGLYYTGHVHTQTGPAPTSPDHEQALDFANVQNAARFALEQHLRDMEIILRYDACNGEVPLPVLPEWCLFEERALRPLSEPAPLAAPLAA